MPFEISEVHELLHSKKENSSDSGCASGGCPGSAPVAFDASGFKMAAPENDVPSALTQWPVQMHLINPAASYFQGADLWWQPTVQVLLTETFITTLSKAVKW